MVTAVLPEPGRARLLFAVTSPVSETVVYAELVLDTSSLMSLLIRSLCKMPQSSVKIEIFSYLLFSCFF